MRCDQLGNALATMRAAAWLFTLPASAAVLGLERNILFAAYLVALASMIGGLGLVYLPVLASIGGYFLCIRRS